MSVAVILTLSVDASGLVTVTADIVLVFLPLIGRLNCMALQEQLVDVIVRGDAPAVSKVLEQKGVDVNALVKGQSGSALTPLGHLLSACKADQKTKCEIASALLRAGANIGTRDSDGLVVIQYTDCSLELMRILLTKPWLQLNITDSLGNTALHFHAIAGNAEHCKLLVEAKAEMNATNNEGNTALMEAVAQGNELAVVALLDLGADSHVENHKGETAASINSGAPQTSKCQELVRDHLVRQLSCCLICERFLQDLPEQLCLKILQKTKVEIKAQYELYRQTKSQRNE